MNCVDFLMHLLSSNIIRISNNCLYACLIVSYHPNNDHNLQLSMYVRFFPNVFYASSSLRSSLSVQCWCWECTSSVNEIVANRGLFIESSHLLIVNRKHLLNIKCSLYSFCFVFDAFCNKNKKKISEYQQGMIEKRVRNKKEEKEWNGEDPSKERERKKKLLNRHLW